MPKYYKKKTEFRIIEKETIEKYIEITKDIEVKVLIILAWLTGARLKELLELKSEGIDILKDELRIRVKTAKRKDHPIREFSFTNNVPFVTTLKGYLLNKTPVFTRKKRWYQAYLERLNKRLYNQNTENFITFHEMRHSRLTFLGKILRASLWELMSFSGHKNAQSVGEYLIHETPERFKDKIG